MKTKGTVYLVGAGPGDPGLLTLRGAELLRRAEVVIYDALVSPQILAMAPASAEKIYGGKRSRDPHMTQDTLNTLLVAKARAGLCVVRLKGGDPYVFGRGGEEAEHLAESGVHFEVVPGVSSFHSVPSAAGIPLTHRDHSSCFTVITGHGDPEREGSEAYWEQFARTPGTKVIMMGTDRLDVLAPTLIQQGVPAETPAAIVSWGTTPRQRVAVGTLATIAQKAAAAKIPPPSVIVIGEVTRLREKLNWFENRPLFGKRIVVTRAQDQAAGFAGKLQELGAEVIEIPTIRFAPPADRTPIVEAMAGLGEYEWIVFTSANGVTSFFDLFHKAFPDLRDLGGLRIAAVGPATAARVRALHLNVDVMPEHHTAKDVVKALSDFESLENLRILLIRAEVGTPDLPLLLEAKGSIVDDVAVYRTEGEMEAGPEAAERLRGEGADWLTFTSGSTVEHFHKRFDLAALRGKFPDLKIATIGPETSKAIVALGLKPDLEARPQTTDALVDALCRQANA
jgi:uroporphyrinogen III methyltransferase/synthase